MAKSLLYMANTTPTTSTAGTTVNLGGIRRKYGCAINGTGDTINITEAGYYDIWFFASFTGSAAGNVILELQQNGVTIDGTKASVSVGTANTQYHSVTIPTKIRVYCCQNSNISILVNSSSTSNPTFQTVNIGVEKI